MSTLGKLVGRAKGIVDKSGDKIAAGVDKATDAIDKKTGGKHHDKLQKIDEVARKLDKKTPAAAAAGSADEAAEPTEATEATEATEGDGSGDGATGA